MMSGLDYINRSEKNVEIPQLLAPIILKLVEDRLSQKNLHCVFDSERIDLTEISDILNGVD